MTKRVAKALRIPLDDRVARINFKRWGMACEEMLIRITDGQFDAAHEILRRFCMGEIPQYCSMTSHPSQALPPRLANVLEAEGYHTMMAVHYASDKELLGIPLFSHESLYVVRGVLKRLLKGEPVVVVEDDFYAEFLRGGES